MCDVCRRTVLVAAMLVTLEGSAAAGSSPAQLPAATDACGRSDASSTGHVRAVTPKAAGLIEQGCARSATFRQLVEILERSDVIAWVETGYLRRPSQLNFAGVSPRARFLRITIRVPAVDDELLPWLAHELQHAVEIASAPTVTSAAAVREFYVRHGQAGPDGGACSRAAQSVSVVVGLEIAHSAMARQARDPMP